MTGCVRVPNVTAGRSFRDVGKLITPISKPLIGIGEQTPRYRSSIRRQTKAFKCRNGDWGGAMMAIHQKRGEGACACLQGTRQPAPMRDISSCETAIAPARAALLNHPVFAETSDLNRLRTLMESHVFAVWDFMSLLKRLQIDFTCIRVPWTIPVNRGAARILNEIVLGEESDIGLDGMPVSHLQLYLLAMEEVGADTGRFSRFHELVEQGDDTDRALMTVGAPQHVRDFVAHTMRVARSGSTPEVLANFFFAREDLIPRMFSILLQRWSIDPESVPVFTFYLQRHIEVDSGDHGPAVRKVIESYLAVGEEVFHGVVDAALRGIRARSALWDGVLHDFRMPGRPDSPGAAGLPRRRMAGRPRPLETGQRG